MGGNGICRDRHGQAGRAWKLNYSSDVDLIYVYASADGETPKEKGHRQASIEPLSNEEYFEILARSLTKALAEQTREGARCFAWIFVFAPRNRRTAGAVGGRVCEVLCTARAGVGAVGPAESLAGGRFTCRRAGRL